MKNKILLSTTLALSFAGFAAAQAATYLLVDNTNGGDVTTGGADFVSQILVGQTVYISPCPMPGLGGASAKRPITSNEHLPAG